MTFPLFFLTFELFPPRFSQKMSLFGKTPTPEEYVKKWKRDLKHEERNLERTIREIEMQEQKTKREIKMLAKKGDMGSAKILAKELLRARKTKERIYKSKAELNSVSMQLTQNLGKTKKKWRERFFCIDFDGLFFLLKKKR